jgi:hypothetical protein
MSMKSTILIATSLALALSAGTAFAGGKKAPAQPIDPRQVAHEASLKAEHPNGRQSWCDMDPKCNGWDQTYQLVGQKKMKIDYRPNEMKF